MIEEPMKESSPPTDVAAEAERTFGLTSAITLLYLACMLVPMVRYALQTRSALPLVAHLAALALAALAISFASTSARARVLRDWLPLALGPFLYIELRWLIEGAGRPHADALVILWETQLFPSNPARTLALRYPDSTLSEGLHAAYALYYPLIYLPAAALYAKKRGSAFATTLFALALTYAVCFVIFVIFPVDGPRYLWGAAAAPEGPMRSAVLWLLEGASSRGTAFPSSHVAASVAASICALRYHRGLGYIVALAAAALTISTVYGGFHYAIDAVAGLVVGTIAALAAMLIVRVLHGTRSQSATAPT